MLKKEPILKLTTSNQNLSQTRFPYTGKILKQMKEVSKGLENFALTMNEDIQNQIESYNQSVKRLALLGWAIPVGIPQRYILKLADKQIKDNEIEDSILEFYTKNNNKEIKSLIDEFKKSNDITKWITLIEECYWAFENRKYLIVIPSLLSIIEGLLMMKLNRLKEKGTKLQTPIQEIIKNYDKNKDPLDWLAWNSVFTFITVLFKNIDFSIEKPTCLNRHWILHGRDTPDWQINDAVRLFNALGIILLLNQAKKT